MRKFFAIFLLIILMLGCVGCVSQTEKTSTKIQIVASLFPQYDFAREIAGDKADITLLAPAGADGHTYEPTPADVIRINESDVFIYTGQYMEAWAQRIIDSVSSDNLRIVDTSKGIDLKQSNHHHGEHEENYDSHIWTNPVYAKMMVDNILEALCEVDSENASYYTERANTYKTELDKLDKEFEETVSSAPKKKMIFGDSFAFLYFTDRYGLEYKAAFDSCSSEAEPGVHIITELIEEINKEEIKAVYYSEKSNKLVPQSIAQVTGAEMLLFHSCHTITKDEMENGVGYLSIMKQNLENLKKGLN